MAIWRTVSNGYAPIAVSAEHITASVPSNTAFATSLTSARVGTGLVIMLSIICVAVMLKRPISRARRIMRFCKAGTAALPTSTAKSPRATMMPSDASMISSKFSIASIRSILDTKPGCTLMPKAAHSLATASRAMCISAAFFTKLTAK